MISSAVARRPRFGRISGRKRRFAPIRVRNLSFRSRFRSVRRAESARFWREDAVRPRRPSRSRRPIKWPRRRPAASAGGPAPASASGRPGRRARTRSGWSASGPGAGPWCARGLERLAAALQDLVDREGRKHEPREHGAEVLLPAAEAATLFLQRFEGFVLDFPARAPGPHRRCRLLRLDLEFGGPAAVLRLRRLGPELPPAFRIRRSGARSQRSRVSARTSRLLSSGFARMIRGIPRSRSSRAAAPCYAGRP